MRLVMVPTDGKQGSTRYYEAAAEKMGGYAALQRFYRYYPVPGMGHCLGTGSVNGVPNETKVRKR
jgi:hypothetical protein